ncbi:hypothetical protein KR093_000005, partial [Drosophila rubida]
SERHLHIVLGNESCDLDSAVSALTLAFIYAQRQQQHDFLPVLNIPRLDYPLKTEVRHMLNKCEIDAQLLLFRDDLPTQLNSDIHVILVDHHVSRWAPLVTEILDHRPLEQQNASVLQLPAQCARHIEPSVGSCATLVAERYLAAPEPRSRCVSQLLHATIVLDTINFEPAARRFCARDLAMTEQLEVELEASDAQQQRLKLFEELVAARADISQLSLAEVLRKDMKQLQAQRHKLPMAGLPMLVRDFIELPAAEQAIRQFAGDSKLVVLLGMFVTPGTSQVQRDVALIAPTGGQCCPLLERVRRALLECQSPSLQLQPHAVDSSFMAGWFMRQLNVQATRKHILPVVQRVLTEWEVAEADSQHCDCDDVYFFKEKPKLGLS